MIGDKLHAVDAAVTSFLQKASKKNEPLEAFRETDSFKKLESAMEAGIMDQATWLAKHLNEVSFLYDENLTADEFTDKMLPWLEKNLPPISDYVSETVVYDALFDAFEASVVGAYARIGVVQKAAPSVEFKLTNPLYIAALEDQANYLLTKSSLDETTISRMSNLIRDSRLNLTTLDELATMIEAEFEGISATRAFNIANTEANQAMSTAQQAFLKENGFKTKVWVPAGPNTCSICQGNADDGAIPLDRDFSSGDVTPPGHPGCECYEDAGDEIDLDSIPVFWDGGGEDALKMAQADIMKVKQQQEAGMAEIKEAIKEQAAESIKHVEKTAAASQRTLDLRIGDLRKYIADNQQAIRKSIEDKSQPINQTIVKQIDLPTELLDLLAMMSQLVAAPQPVKLSEYKPHDEEEGATDYYGFLHPSGAWYIVEGIDDQQRYAAGTSGYRKAWDDRKDLDYTYINEAFK